MCAVGVASYPLQVHHCTSVSACSRTRSFTNPASAGSFQAPLLRHKRLNQWSVALHSDSAPLQGGPERTMVDLITTRPLLPSASPTRGILLPNPIKSGIVKGGHSHLYHSGYFKAFRDLIPKTWGENGCAFLITSCITRAAQGEQVRVLGDAWTLQGILECW